MIYVFVDDLYVDDLSVDELSVDELCICRYLSVDDLSADDPSVDDISVDDPSVRSNEQFLNIGRVRSPFSRSNRPFSGADIYVSDTDMICTIVILNPW